MKETVLEEENENLRSCVNALQRALAEAQAKNLELTSGANGGHDGDAGAQAEPGRAPGTAHLEASKQTEWLARLPVENPNPVVRTSAQGIVIFANRAAAEMAGWKCAMGEPLPAPLQPLLESALLHGTAVEEDVSLSGTDYSVYIAPFAHEGYAHIYGRNISARRQAESEARQSREELRRLNEELQERNAELETERRRWQTIVESIADEVWVCDTEGRMSLMNAHAAAALKLDSFQPMLVDQVAEELEIVDTDGQPRPREQTPLLRSLSGQTLHGQEIARERGSGRLYYRQYSTAPTHDAQGRITGAVAIVQDITALKEAEKAVTESRNRIHDILISLGDGLLAVDRQWKLIYVNPTATRIAGQSANQLIGANLWELWPGLVGTPLEGVYRGVMEDGVPRQVRVMGIEHTTRWYDVNVYPSSEGITVYYSDKTEQIAAEGARAALLAENQEQRGFLEAIFDADPGGIAVFSRRDLRFTFVNRAYRALLPMPGMDPVGKTLEDVWPPELGFRVLESYLPPGREDQPVTHDNITRRFPDGSTRQFSIHLRPIQWHGERATLVVAWEITQLERAKAELEEYAEKLKRSNQDLQEFAMIASHDLQEPLRKIETFGDMLSLRAAGLDERSRDHIERMRNAAQRMRGMIEGLLQLSRVSTQAQPFAAVNLSKVTEEVVSDLGNQVRRTHGTLDVGPLPIVEGDTVQLRQLLQNLISNALKYHQPDTEPMVRIFSKQVRDSVEIMVEDNGIGFEQENAERIFEPFQRLVPRSEYEGSGMGLAICRRIVERHKGGIKALSTPGKGTTFIVTLPMAHPQSGELTGEGMAK